MKIEFLGKRNPYHVLGVPSFANEGLIRSAYRKRVNVLHLYHFDKATQPAEWQIVHDMLCELTEAYVHACLSNQDRNDHSTATVASESKPRPVMDNQVETPLNVGNTREMSC